MAVALLEVPVNPSFGNIEFRQLFGSSQFVASRPFEERFTFFNVWQVSLRARVSGGGRRSRLLVGREGDDDRSTRNRGRLRSGLGHTPST